MVVPQLSIGLPVYNGAQYLAESLDALLGQTFEDFELIISSNASTDATDDICREYQAQDPRIVFTRQPRNIGAAPNHHVVLRDARAPLFKWASADDLYARDLVERCIALLDEDPDAVLAHSWTAAIDPEGDVFQALEYPLATGSPSAPERLRSLLFDGDDMPGAIRADDFYGVMRTDVLRRVRPHGSYYHADQTFMAEIALHGPFRQVPEWLYFRRHHPDRAHQAYPTAYEWCVNLDPKRASRLRNPSARLVSEFVWNQLTLPRRAPLSLQDRRLCNRHLRRWALTRVSQHLPRRSPAAGLPVPEPSLPSRLLPRTAVAGQDGGR